MTLRDPRGTGGSGTVVLLGPQDPAPDVGAVLAELGIRGRVALVRAGYQERESEDAELVAALGVPVVNLRLHARAIEVFAGDREFKEAYQARQNWLRHVQRFYRVRLEKTDDGARMIAVRHVDPELLAQEDKVSVDQFRQLDLDHVERCTAVRVAFDERWRLGERPIIARHRAELREELETAHALVIAGGHVASLLNRLRLFGIEELAQGKTIFAWCGGAMAISERVVLFHDSPPQGPGAAEVLDAGLGFVGEVIVLPQPEFRLKLGDRARLKVMARRFAPATCIAMPARSRVTWLRSGPTAPYGAFAIRDDGTHSFEPETRKSGHPPPGVDLSPSSTAIPLSKRPPPSKRA